MSSQPFRAAFRAAWPVKLPAIPYLDTINVQVDRSSLPAIWGTLGFAATSRTYQTMGINPWVLEIGTVTILIVAKSGVGDSAGVTAATAAQAAFDGWRSLDYQMWLDAVGAPTQMELESDGDWILFGVPCTYGFQSRVILPN